MNLQEQTNRIKQMMGINESIYLRRRIDNEVINELYYEVSSYVLEKIKMFDIKTVSEFKSVVIRNMLHSLETYLQDSNQTDYQYEEIENFLSNQFSEDMEKKYHFYITR
jgi:hypothetical protein